MPISTFCPNGKYHSIHQSCCPICIIETLTAELENRKRQFDAYCDAEEINNAGLEQEISTLQSALNAADKRNDDLKRFNLRQRERMIEAAAFHAACAHISDLYGEDSERGLAPAEILRYQRNSFINAISGRGGSDDQARQKVLSIARSVADDLRSQHRPVPGHTQAIIEDLEAVLDSSLVFYDPCQTCNPNGSGQCFGHG